MSIFRNNNKLKNSLSERFSKIARFESELFYTSDFASLWSMRDSHVLNMTLKRYADKGLLFRVYRGLYAVKPVEHIDPLVLGEKALHRFSYISTETVLVQAGIIAQHVKAVTLVSSVSKKFSISPHDFISRQLADRFLLNEYGVVSNGGIKKATTERAVADMLYFNPKAYFDADHNIDWKKVRDIQRYVGYPLTPQRYV